LRIADPRISRAHLILRFDQGRWLAIDNGSLNGTYVNGYRMPVIDIHDGQSINVGNPQGPRLTFAIGPQQGHSNRPHQPWSTPGSGPPTLSWSVNPGHPGPNPPPPRQQAPRRPASGPPPPRVPPRAMPPDELTAVHAGSEPPAHPTPRAGTNTDDVVRPGGRAWFISRGGIRAD